MTEYEELCIIIRDMDMHWKSEGSSIYLTPQEVPANLGYVVELMWTGE